MHRATAFALGLALAGWTGAAFAQDPFDQVAPIAEAELGGQRGGTETAPDISGSVIQTNDTNQSGTNNGNISIGANAAKISGSIREATVTGNHGVTAVMQNTGDLVNMNNATSVNVFLQ
ncbi:MAG TPA: hypothetical protein VLL76_11100 [Candidatus Omnitrophota bacterium]|nr:hypothetical protein [Candidatus Omnitrophota bacterium]